MESNVDIPPQRDIRETQPTISVNYRVVKNINDNNLKKDRNYSNPDNDDDWDNGDNDWQKIDYLNKNVFLNYNNKKYFFYGRKFRHE